MENKDTILINKKKIKFNPMNKLYLYEDNDYIPNNNNIIGNHNYNYKNNNLKKDKLPKNSISIHDLRFIENNLNQNPIIFTIDAKEINKNLLKYLEENKPYIISTSYSIVKII
jgi:hypothetical protein